MENTITPDMLIKKLIRGWKTLFLFVLVAIIVTSVWTLFFMKPLYQASIQVFIPITKIENSSSRSLADINKGKIGLIKGILSSEKVTAEIRKNILKDETFEITSNSNQPSYVVTNEDNSQFFTIRTTAPTSKLASSQVFEASQVLNIILKKDLKQQAITIPSKKTIDISLFFPRKKINLLLGAIMGFILGSLYLILKKDLDKIN